MQPYTYLIEHIHTGKKYYGVKFSKDSNPNTFWVDYFTSSKIVKDIINKYGKESFLVKIDKVFNTPEEAVLHELQFLRSITDKVDWLNQHFGTGYNFKFALYKTEKHKEKIRKANSKPKSKKAREACIRNGKLGAEARRGQKDSEETKRKRSKSLSKAISGVPRPNNRKEIIIEGKRYLGFEMVCEEFKVTRQTVANRIKSDKWDWHYATTK